MARAHLSSSFRQRAEGGALNPPTLLSPTGIRTSAGVCLDFYPAGHSQSRGCGHSLTMQQPQAKGGAGNKPPCLPVQGTGTGTPAWVCLVSPQLITYAMGVMARDCQGSSLRQSGGGRRINCPFSPLSLIQGPQLGSVWLSTLLATCTAGPELAWAVPHYCSLIPSPICQGVVQELPICR